MEIRRRTVAVAVSRALLYWGCVAALAPMAVWAADGSNPVPDPNAPATAASASTTDAGSPGDSTSLERVVVTAQSRTQTVQTVPISIQVVTQEQMDKLEAVNLGSMNGYIPGLQVDAHEPTQPEFTIRGITNNDFGIGTDSPIGVYVDGVYGGKTGGALLNFNDIQRVEVLNGPQGTLFGRNSAGGAISVITNDPSHDLEADLTVRGASYGTDTVHGVLNVPLSDHLAARLSIVSYESAGWLLDQSTGQHYENANDKGSRLQLLWDGWDHTKVVLGWEHEELEQLPTPGIAIVNPPPPPNPGVPNPNLFPNIAPSAYINPLTAPLYNDPVDGQESRHFDGVTLRATHDFANGYEFTSTSAWRHFDSYNLNDRTGTGQQDTYFTTANIEGNSTWQQEFRLNGTTGIADWVGGASYYLEHANQASQLNTYTDTLNTLFNNDAGQALYSLLAGQGLPVLGLPWQETMNNQGDYHSVAVYGDVIWHVTPAFSVTTGARLTKDYKEFSWYDPNRVAPALDAVLDAPGVLPTVAGYGVPTQLLTNSVLIQTTGDTTAPFTTSQSWTDFSPRFVLQYQLTPSSMVYGSVTKGYQAGGFNTLDVNSQYQPETVVNYEIGAKTQIPELHLLADATLFHYKFDHLQNLTLVPSNNQYSPPSYQVTSSDESASGLDLQLRWKPTRDLQFFFVTEYIDQKYDDDVAADGVVLNGQAVGTPFWTGALGGDYAWRNVFDGTLDLTLQGTFTGPSRCNADSLPTGGCLQTPAFQSGSATHRADFRLAWDAPGRRWGAAFFVQNVFNNRYVSGLDLISAGKLGTPVAQISAPRMIGLELSAHY